jgi:hypothetical protein
MTNISELKYGNPKNYARTTDNIGYPQVSSCMTLTLIYTGVAVGAHFGLCVPTGKPAPANRPDELPVELCTKQDVINVLGNMTGLVQKDGKLQRALLIGSSDSWKASSKEAWGALEDFCKKADPQYVTYGTDADADGNGGSVDIEVYRDGRQYIIKKTVANGGTTLTTKTWK